MKPFVVNGHDRLVLPSNFGADLDFSVLETLEQLGAVIRRNFEANAPTGTEILERVDWDGYRSRYELLRDLAPNLVWGNRYAMPMYEKRPARWRDLPRRRDDVFLPSRRARDPLDGAEGDERARLRVALADVRASVRADKLGEVAAEFDRVHRVERPLRVGSIDAIIPAARLRPHLIEAPERGMRRTLKRPPQEAEPS
jgi:hypothetical protein